MSMTTAINDSAPAPKADMIDARLELRERARRADALTSAEIPLASIWSQLIEGACTIVDGFFSVERCYLLLRARTKPERVLQGRRLEIVEAALSGVCQNVISIEMQLAASSVALNARIALDALGARCRPSRAHPLLMLASRAARDHDFSRVAALSFVEDHGSGLLTISVARPDAALAALVSPAELCVVQGLVEGCSYAEIAHRRGTSSRTIANQISSVFRRLAVSGRNELLHSMFALPPVSAFQPAAGGPAEPGAPVHGSPTAESAPPTRRYA